MNCYGEAPWKNREAGMPGKSERVSVARFAVWMALILSGLVTGCEGDLHSILMQRDLDSLRSEVAAVSRTNEGDRVFIEQQLAKVEAELKSKIEKAYQERNEDLEGFMRSQASLSTKLDDVIAEGRLTQGRFEETSQRISELTKRVDALVVQVGQLVRRMEGYEKQLSQAVAAGQEANLLAQQATTAAQQTAQGVTNALQQMAEQTNAALQQMNTSTQLALSEARKASAAKQTAQPIAQQAPTVVKLPPPISASPPAGTAPSPAPPALPARPAANPMTPDELYKNALNDYTKGKYDLAIDGFRTYIIQYPETSLLPNAQYWLAECFYSLKNYSLATKEFDRFLADYPDNPKARGAMLKQGYAYLEMGNTPQGRTALNNLIKRFPKSPEAKSAKNRLSKIKRKKSTGSGSGAKSLSKRAQ